MRWRDLPRTARLGERQPGNQTSCRRAWESPRRRRISPAIGGHEGSRLWTRGTRGDPAELPRRLAVGYGGNDERRLPCRGTDIQKHWNKIKTFQNGKQNGLNGRRLRLWSGLLSRCTHEGGTGTRRRGYKLKL